MGQNKLQAALDKLEAYFKHATDEELDELCRKTNELTEPPTENEVIPITAVEWLKSFMLKPLSQWPDDYWQQAKEMEKKQIIDSWTDGYMLGVNGWITEDYNRGIGYYCKTFNKKYDDEI